MTNQTQTSNSQMLFNEITYQHNFAPQELIDLRYGSEDIVNKLMPYRGKAWAFNHDHIVERGATYNYEQPYYLLFVCPCGNHLVEIGDQSRVSQSFGGKWNFTIEENKLSVNPSIDTTNNNFKCHFWLTDNKVTQVVEV